MNAQRVRRLFAVSAAGVLLAGAATMGAAGTASAAAPADHHNRHGHNWCDNDRWWNGHCDFRNGFHDGGVVVIVVG